jgi:hypothetical protein
VTTVPPPICEACKHRGYRDDGPGWACVAFPHGIPDAIAVDGFDHREPFDGDGGWRFELDPAKASLLWAFLDGKAAPT